MGKEFLTPLHSSTAHWHVLLRLALLAILESLLAGYWHTEVLFLTLQWVMRYWQVFLVQQILLKKQITSTEQRVLCILAFLASNFSQEFSYFVFRIVVNSIFQFTTAFSSLLAALFPFKYQWMNLIYNEIYHPILLWYIACIPKYGKRQLYDKLTEELEPIRNGKIF